ncbi:MAG TPA: EAL domain-containing protein [Solirubrobacteraceae bacterium]|nr:EAL domain-containing protein [Solirubrobacteraceae bacterium]
MLSSILAPITTTLLESIEDAPVGIAVLAPGGRGRILGANRTLCQMLGRSEAELVATPLAEITHPEDRQATDVFHAQVRTQGSGEIEKRFRHRDGRYVWVLASAAPLRGEDGRIAATLSHFFDISQRREAESRLAESERLHRRILQTTADGFWAYAPDRRIVTANERIARMLGYATRHEVLGTSLDDHLFPEDRAASRVRQRERREGVEHGTYEVRMRRRDGRECWVELTPNHLPGRDGGDGGGFAFLRDVTQRRATRAELTRALQLRRLLVTHLPDTVAVMFDGELRCLLVEGSAAPEAVLGLRVGVSLSAAASWPDADRGLLTERCRAALGGLTQTVDLVRGERILALTITPVWEVDGSVQGGLLVARDVTQARRDRAQLTALAEKDPLTGLANRAAFRAALEAALAAEMPGALVFLDLDNFKQVNDSLGHDAGDELLVEVAARLEALVGEGQLVARPSGDEFCLLLSGFTRTSEITRVAHAMLDLFDRPFLVRGAEVFVGASAGLARLGRDGRDVSALLTAADMAMYAAKADGRRAFRFFRPEMAERAQARLTLTSDLYRALARSEFVLHYQPQLRLRDARVTSLEALVRWNHPSLGLLAPDRFISLAEESGLIVPLGEWVLEEACRQLAAWRAQGLRTRVAVNVAARQLVDAAFPGVVAAALARHGLPAAALELEITESALMDAERSVAILDQLKRIGVSIAIDDFGTGFSSLARLRRLPVDVLKIDRAFIAELDSHPRTAAVVRSIIALAHNLGMEALAEGVERPSQRDRLLSEGCDLAGGWLWSRAVPAGAVPPWLTGAPARISDTDTHADADTHAASGLACPG